MENDSQKKWPYILIVLLLLALVIETGVLLSKKSRKPEQPPYSSEYISPRLHSSRLRPQRQPPPPAQPASAALFSQSPHAPSDWDPFEEMRRMQEEMNRVFDESFGRGARQSGFFNPAVFGTGLVDSFSPAMDLQETKDAYIAKADLPGLDKDKIQVNVSENMLTLQGERRVENEKEDTRQGFYSSERSYGSFSRTLPLPGPVDESRITADYKNGVALPQRKGQIRFS